MNFVRDIAGVIIKVDQLFQPVGSISSFLTQFLLCLFLNLLKGCLLYFPSWQGKLPDSSGKIILFYQKKNILLTHR